MKVLVTGASGLIGGRLCVHLADAGRDVVAHARTPQSAVRIPSLPDLETRIGPDAGDLAGIDAIVHLAAPGGADAAADPKTTLLATTEATRALLAAAVNAGCRRFVYLSTVKVYGAATGRIAEATATRPLDDYAITHRAAEDYVLAAHETGKIEGAVLRLANGFGAPVHRDVNCWSIIVNSMARKAVTEGRVSVFGAVRSMRSFVPLADVCAGIDHALALDKGTLGDGLFNLGAGCDLTILAMAERVASRAGAILGTRVAVDAPSGDPMPETVFDVTKLARTGFAATADLDGEIDRLARACVDWFGDRA